MRMRFWMTVTAAAALGAGSARAQEGIPLQEVTRVARVPTIDGRLDDAVWKQASRLVGFAELFARDPGPAKVRTDAYAAYDDRALYLAARCYEPHMDRVRATFTGRDNAMIWRDDCVELFFDPANVGEQFGKVTIGAGGGVTDQWRIGRHYDAKWDAKGLKTAVVRGKDAWVWEMALPWQAFGTRCPEGRVWTFCLVRFSYTTGKLVGASWSPGGHSGTPDRHGLLSFGPTLEAWVVPVAKRRGARWSIGQPGYELRYRQRSATIAELADRIEQRLATASLELASVGEAACVKALRTQLGECRSGLAKRRPKPDAAPSHEAMSEAAVQRELERLAGRTERLLWECRMARLCADTTY